MDISRLLTAARRHAHITALRGVKAQGAEAYLQAIAYINGGHEGLSDQELRDMAYGYLEISTDRQWQRRRYFEGAETARRVIRRLQ